MAKRSSGHSQAKARRRKREAEAKKQSAQAAKWEFSRGDVTGLLGIPLGIAGLVVDNVTAVAVLIGMAILAPCVAIALRPWSAKRKAAFVAPLVAVGVGGFAFLKSEHDQKELEKTTGVLEVANLPSPKGDCSVSETNFTVYAGGGAYVSQGQTYDVLTSGGKKLISLEREKEGVFRIRKLQLFDDRGDALTDVSDNKIWIKDGVRKERRDKSTIAIYDHNNDEVLYMSMLNDHAVQIRGVFRTPAKGRPPVVVTDNYVRVGFNTMYAPCFVNGGFNIN